MPVDPSGTIIVDQSRAAAQGDIAGRDINYKINNSFGDRSAPRAAGIVEQLLQRLNDELKNDQKAQNTIDKLQRYYKNRASDGVMGLEAKLQCAGRADTFED